VIGEEICSTESMVLVRSAGKSAFDKSAGNCFTSVYCDLDGDGTAELIPRFDDRIQDYVWNTTQGTQGRPAPLP
jgi:hypothetical protein